MTAHRGEWTDAGGLEGKQVQMDANEGGLGINSHGWCKQAA